jgi:hypothetical protein
MLRLWRNGRADAFADALPVPVPVLGISRSLEMMPRLA